MSTCFMKIVIYINAGVPIWKRKKKEKAMNKNSNNNNITIHLPIFPWKTYKEKEKKNVRQQSKYDFQ
jgi:hypothetical protein